MNPGQNDREQPRAMTSGEYLALDEDGRAMARCFIDFTRLPREALEDMRTLSIIGSSLARQIVDEDQQAHAKSEPPYIGTSTIRDAYLMVDRYKDGPPR